MSRMPQVIFTGEIAEELLALGYHLHFVWASCWDTPSESLLSPVPIWYLPPGSSKKEVRSLLLVWWLPAMLPKMELSHKMEHSRFSWHEAIMSAKLLQCNNDSRGDIFSNTQLQDRGLWPFTEPNCKIYGLELCGINKGLDKHFVCILVDLFLS